MCAMLESDGGSPVHMLVRYLGDSNLYINIVSPTSMVEPGKPMLVKIAFNGGANIDVDAKHLSDAKVTVQSVVKDPFLNLVRFRTVHRTRRAGAHHTRGAIRKAPILLFEGCVKRM